MDALLKYIPLIFGQNPLLWAGLGATLIVLCAVLIGRRWVSAKASRHTETATSLADMVEQNSTAQEMAAAPASINSGNDDSDDDDALIEELTIPRVGQEVPEEETAPESVQETPAPSDAPQKTHDKETLAEIERKMKALRELHDAGLIATEIYLLKSRELSKDI